MILTPRDAVLNVARSYIGVAEQGGPNAGQIVERMLAFVGLKKGDPWCCAAVCYIGHAALNDPWPVLRTGGCAVLGEWAGAHKILETTPQVGDIVLYWHQSLRRFAHTGFVELTLGEGKITALEGNTNDDGGRDGWKYLRKTRTIGPFDRFVRWESLLA